MVNEQERKRNRKKPVHIEHDFVLRLWFEPNGRKASLKFHSLLLLLYQYSLNDSILCGSSHLSSFSPKA